MTPWASCFAPGPLGICFVSEYGVRTTPIGFICTVASVGSPADVLVEPGDRALPGEVRRGFVVPLRRGVVVEAVHGVGVDVAFVRHLRLGQLFVVIRPRAGQ